MINIPHNVKGGVFRFGDVGQHLEVVKHDN